MERYVGITASDLSLLLQNHECLLILDCRSFMAFNDGHISTAVNVHCPPILKRRSGGFVSLENILPCEAKRKQLLSGYFHKVVMYDSETNELSKTSSPPDSNLYSVIKSFNQQIKMENVFYLHGGFKAFAHAYSHLCTNHSSPVTIDTWEEFPRKIRGVRPSNPDDCPVEILPHLFLGDCGHASRKEVLDRLGITALLNVSIKCKNYFSHDFLYKTIPVDDTSFADLSSWFYDAIDFIDLVEENGGKVLLHCKAGVSRSATICLAYLMVKKGYSLEQAYQYVHSRRSVIAPNLNFMRQLHDFEKELAVPEATVLTSSFSATGGKTPTFSWPLPSVTVSHAPQTDFLDFKFDFSPLNSPTVMVGSLLSPS